MFDSTIDLPAVRPVMLIPLHNFGAGVSPTRRRSLFPMLKTNGAPTKLKIAEAESRKVGDIILPGGLYTAMRAGHIVELQAPTAYRVQVLMDDYLATPESHEQIAERLPFLENRLGAKWVGILSELLAARDYVAVTEILLERYYDPLYDHSGRDLTPARVVNPSEPGAVEALLAEREAARAGLGSG